MLSSFYYGGLLIIFINAGKHYCLRMITMAEDEDARREARRAQLLAAMNPQSAQAQDLARQQQQGQAQQMRDLSQMRPVVQQSVAQGEQRATQVVTATFGLFRDMIERSGDPDLKRAFRESSLNTMLG